jgi:RHS repeat-associated protein
LGGNHDPVRFDWDGADRLAGACDSAASLVEGQIGSRRSWRQTGLEEFRGRFAELFSGNGDVQIAAVNSLAAALRTTSGDVRALATAARQEQDRRDRASAWEARKADIERHDDFFDWIADAGKGIWDRLWGDQPQMDPIIPPDFSPVAPVVGRREPLQAGFGGGGAGTSSADPANLRLFAVLSRGGDRELDDWPSRLRGLYADFTASCGYGGVDASGVWAGFQQYLTDNDEDARWADAVAAAFESAGGSGALALPDAALREVLQSAGVDVSRQGLAIDPPQAFGGQATSGYADDPVNTALGNFTETEVDLGFTGGCAGLAFDRVYNSLEPGGGDGGFGPGWSSWAGSRLVLSADGARWVRPDGRVSLFPRLGDGWDRADGEALWLAASGGETPGAGGEGSAVAGEDAAGLGDGDAPELFGGGSAGLTVSDNAGGRWRFSAAGRLTSVCRGAGSRVDFVYDGRGRLSGLSHERGRFVSVEWDEVLDRITGVVGSDGRRVSYAYDGQGRLVQAVRPDGGRSYGWDEAGRVVSVADGDGVVEVENAYDGEGRVVAQRSEFGRVSRYSYLPGQVTVVSDGDGGRANTWVSDERGRLLRVADAAGNAQSCFYDRFGNRSQVVGRDGGRTVRLADERGRLVREVLPSGAEIRTVWDDLDRIAQVVVVNDGVEAVTAYGYEGKDRNPSRIVDAEGGVTRLAWSGGLLKEVVDPTGVRLRFDHDVYGDLTAVADAAGNAARLTRDSVGRVTAAVTPLGNATSFAYDEVSGLLTSRRDPAGGVTRWERTAAGRLSAVVDPLGNRTAIAYGGHGQRSEVVDPLGRRVESCYDDLGNLESVGLPDGSKWRFGYDGLSRLERLEDAAGGRWGLSFDVEGRLVGSVDPTGVARRVELNQWGLPARVADGDDWRSAVYDRLGRVVEERGPDGLAVKNRYDLCGRLAERIGPTGETTRWERDLAGRVTAVTQPSGETYRYEYDQCGRWAATVSTGGSRYEMAYDADSRICGERWPDGGQVATEFDGCGRVIARREPGKGLVKVRYDKAGRLVETRDGWFGLRRFRYDEAGQLAAAVDALGSVTRFEYDGLGRVAAVVSPLGARSERVCDPMGRVTSLTDPMRQTTVFSYDKAGRPLRRRGALGQLAWTYDSQGRLSETRSGNRLLSKVERDFKARKLHFTGGSGPAVDLVFDHRGNLTSRSRGGLKVAWAYDGDGRRESMTGPDGIAARYFYDADSRVAAVERPDLGRVVLDRDGLGRIVGLAADGVRAAWEYADGWVVKHTVDKRGFIQVVEVERDADGRAIAQTADGLRTVFSYDEAGQLVCSRSSEGLEIAYAYDRDGRLTSETAAGKTTRYVYGAAGQLVSARHPDGQVTVYAYDQAGRRVREAGPAGERLFAWDPRGFLARVTAVVRNQDQVQSASRNFHLAPDGELAAIDETPVWWDSAGGLPQLLAVGQTAITGIGPAQAVIDAGAVTWSDLGRSGPASSDPWALAGGAAPGGSASGALAAGVSLSGLEDVSLGVGASLTVDGLGWLGARVYDPRSRGFLSVDPLLAPPGAVWGSNPYSYAGNDPVNLVDPWGLSPVTDQQLRAYQDQYSSGLAGGISQAWDAAGAWLEDNWEYVAAGAMIVAGGVMMATGVGGPVGMALVSSGGDALIQKITTGTVDWREVAVNGVIGLASGGIAGAAGRAAAGKIGSCLGKNIISGAVEGAVDSGVSGGLSYLVSGEPVTVQGLAQATLGGALIGGAVGGAAGALTKVTDVARYGCFEEDTPVLMADGTSKPIQNIQPGDLVAAYDPDTSQTESRPVTGVHVHENVPTLRVTTAAGPVVTTATHPFYVESKGYTPAGDLHAGDRLRTPDGATVEVETIQATGQTQTVYNLQVVGLHCYYVIAGILPILVHNTCNDANQANREIARGQAPRGVTRVDTPEIPHEKLHVHFSNGAVLNDDGTWKHGMTAFTRKQKEWLKRHGFALPDS